MTTSIFISYRRGDAAKSSWRLFDWLERQFGTENVFFDRESIPLGERFPNVIEEKLATSGVLIAIIGPAWADIADESGLRRLWQDGDYVAHEVATALRLQKRVIPVFVDGAGMPAGEDLPPTLHALADCEGIALDDAHYPDDFERLVDAIVGRPRGFARRQIDLVQRLARFAKRGSVIVPLAALAAFFAAWVGLFARLGLDTWIASFGMALAMQRTPVDDEQRVAIVALDEASERRLGHKYDGAPAWRGRHAQLLDRLTQAGAAVVVFDFFFERATEFDGRFARAVHAAQERGSRVVFAMKELDAGAPRLAPALRATGADWGVACLGHQQGYLFSAPLARAVAPQRAANPFEALAEEPADTPTLALAASFGGTPDLIRTKMREIILQGAERGVAPVGFSSLEQWQRSRCPALPDDVVVASRLLLLSPLTYWRNPARRLDYADVVDPAAPLPTSLRGDVVVVGLATRSGRDEYTVRQGLASEDRFGVELQADAIRNLLSGFTLRPLKPGTQLIWMLALASLGAVAAFFTAGRPRSQRMALLAAMLAVYATLAAAMLVRSGTLFNPVYDLGAFLITFAILGRLERRTATTPAYGG
jgi:CHASE2 domain-containing sensor protein